MPFCISRYWTGVIIGQGGISRELPPGKYRPGIPRTYKPTNVHTRTCTCTCTCTCTRHAPPAWIPTCACLHLE